MNPIRRRPCADPVQKQVPGERITQKGIDSSRPVTEARMSEAISTSKPFSPFIHPHVAALIRATVDPSALRNPLSSRRHHRPSRPATGLPGHNDEMMNVANRAHWVPIRVSQD